MSKCINLSLYCFYEWGSKELNFCLLKDSGLKDTTFYLCSVRSYVWEWAYLARVCFPCSFSRAAIRLFNALSRSFAGLCSAILGHPTLPCPNWLPPPASILVVWLSSDPLRLLWFFSHFTWSWGQSLVSLSTLNLFSHPLSTLSKALSEQPLTQISIF